MTTSGRAGQAADQRADGEHAEADEQRTLAPEAVAEGTRREQQAGEHQGVGVDDPLQHRGAGVELGLQRRQRHVQRRHRHHDHDQRQAQHAEQEPAALVDFGPGVEREIGHRNSPRGLRVGGLEQRNVNVALCYANVSQRDRRHPCDLSRPTTNRWAFWGPFRHLNTHRSSLDEGNKRA